MQIVAGIDIGSLSTDTVVMGDGALLGFSILPTGANSRKAAEDGLRTALEMAGKVRDDLAFIVATGYGRANVPFAGMQVTEITCHGRGALYLFPGARTVIDIGGQDSKVIRLDAEGAVVDFAMNDKCAAGTGRFLEVMARALETGLKDLSNLAGRANQSAAISSVCTVFAESEVVSLIGQGRPREEIARGLLDSVAERAAVMVQRVGVMPEVVMTGGVAKNAGVVRAIRERLGVEILVPDEPQIVGALGAALVARGKAASPAAGQY